ncbi:MAG: hypothetical protein WCS94_01705 [Verrucomicrobiota bacterium]
MNKFLPTATVVLLALLNSTLRTVAEAQKHARVADLLHDSAAWSNATPGTAVTTTTQGLRVEVAEGRKEAIATASGLALPTDLARVRVRVAKVGGGARWFIRLFGELRRPGENNTAYLAAAETAGERIFDIDPRLWALRDRPVQLQLGVVDAPGAFVVFEDVEFLPALKHSNRQPRTIFQSGQKDIAAVELMPNLPEPYKLIDWREKARAYDQFVFNFKARGEYLPLVWLDETHLNLDRPTFGLPSYVATPDQACGITNSQEGVTCMGAVLGATLAGVDKSRQEYDYVDMCEAWFNSRNGLNLVLNRQIGGTGGTFWYEMFTHMVFYALTDRYPDKTRLAEIMRITADRWHGAYLDLCDSNGVPDFNHTSFDFRTRKGVSNPYWREPDAAGGMAWMQYAAWMKFHDSNYLAAAENCLNYLQGLKANPYYEVLLPYGTLTAARLNAEQGRDYNVDRLLEWCFGISDCRGGWGILLGNWGGYDCDGLQGSIDNRGGYGFAMNTFAQAGALMPLPRYEPKYARAIGKWMLNLVNSARLFYPGAMSADHESGPRWKTDPQHVIAYEALRYEWQGKSPCATGDPVAMKWGPKTDLGLYGSSYAGILGAIVRPTSDSRILQLDCLATDFFRAPAYPTFLYYNPHLKDCRITLELGDKNVTIYDVVGKKILASDVKGKTKIIVPADSAVIAVSVPADGKVRHEGRKLLVNDIVVDWSWEQTEK